MECNKAKEKPIWGTKENGCEGNKVWNESHKGKRRAGCPAEFPKVRRVCTASDERTKAEYRIRRKSI